MEFPSSFFPNEVRDTTMEWIKKLGMYLCVFVGHTILVSAVLQ